jgi:hypothetical protein
MRISMLRAHWLGNGLRASLVALGLAFSLTAWAGQLNVGDVFIAVGTGSYQVWRNTGTAGNPNYQLMETFADNLGGITAGCAIDSTFRFYGTNLTNTRVERFAIAHPHAVTLSFDASNGGVDNQSQSIAFDGAGFLYVGHESDGVVHQYDELGTLLQSFNVQTENGGVEWLDISADSSTLFYTSKGKKIFRFSFAGGQLSPFVDFTNNPKFKGTFYALRILPDGSVLVTGGTAGVLKFDSNGNQVTFSVKLPNKADVRALTLDSNGTSFWVGDSNGRQVYRFSIQNGGNAEASINPNITSGPFGLCVGGGFGVAQPSTVVQTATVNPSDATANSALFNIPPGQTTPPPNQFTVTLNGTPNSPVTLTLYSVDFDSTGSNAGFTDPTSGPALPCIPDSASATPKCQSYKLEVSPDCKQAGTCSSNLQLYLPNFVLSGTTNPKFFADMGFDETSFGLSGSYRTGGTGSTQFELVNVAAAAAVSCGYQSPIVPGGVYNLGQNLTFKFRARTAAGDCPHGPFFSFSQPPRLTQVFEPAAACQGCVVPAPVKEAVVVTGNSGTTNGQGDGIYSLSGGDTWDIEISTKALQDAGLAGKYIYTTFDDTGNMPLFSVEITLQ